MIKRLPNKEIEIAKNIRTVFQASYKIEAKLLNAINFPPLQRPIEDYVECNSAFYGYTKNEALVGVVEIIHDSRSTLIRSLVVDPLFFRQGIARKLMEFVLSAYDSNLFVVETGVDNVPASRLYEKFGFIEVHQWETDHGIRKVKFEKSMDK